MRVDINNLSKEYLKETAVKGLAKLEKQGITRDALKSILDIAVPITDLSEIYYDYEMNYDEIQDFFSESRKHAVDLSMDYAYGGSSSSTMLGLNPYETPIDIWMDLKGIPRKKKDAQDIFMAGHVMEPVYMTYFEKRFGDRYKVIRTDIEWKSKVYEHFLFNLDGLLLDKETGELGVLEIKHTGINNMTMINDFKNSDVPKQYETQGRAYMEGIGAKFCVFCLGYGNRLTDIEICRIESDDVDKDILSGCENFIDEYVVANVRPPVTSIKDPDLAKAAIKEIYGEVEEDKEVMMLSDSLKSNIDELLKAKEVLDEKTKIRSAAEKEEKEAKKAFELLTIPIIEEMKTAPEAQIEIDGEIKTISRFGRRTLNIEKLQNDFPDIYDKVQKPGVDSTKLKSDFPEAYNACALKSTNSFKIS